MALDLPCTVLCRDMDYFYQKKYVNKMHTKRKPATLDIVQYRVHWKCEAAQMVTNLHSK